MIENNAEYLKCILARDLLKGKFPNANISYIVDFVFHRTVLDYRIAEYEQETFNSVAKPR